MKICWNVRALLNNLKKSCYCCVHSTKQGLKVSIVKRPNDNPVFVFHRDLSKTNFLECSSQKLIHQLKCFQHFFFHFWESSINDVMLCFWYHLTLLYRYLMSQTSSSSLWRHLLTTHFVCTFKPVYNDHPWNSKIVVVVDRWSLFRGHLCKWDLKMVVAIGRWSHSEVVVSSGLTV